MLEENEGPCLPCCIGHLGTWVAIDGIVYLFSSEEVLDQDFMPALIASFDLETEEWRPAIRGPVTSSPVVDADGYPIGDMGWGDCLT